MELLLKLILILYYSPIGTSMVDWRAQWDEEAAVALKKASTIHSTTKAGDHGVPTTPPLSFERCSNRAASIAISRQD
jgi:hypothetical protein